MVKCYWCNRNDTDSYWNYYCDTCVKVKNFCKLIGSEKLVKSLQFKINDEKLEILTNKELHGAVTEKERHKGVPGLDPDAEPTTPKSDPQKPRKSPRLGQNNQ